MADVGGADGSDDEQDQDQEAATPDMEIGGETEDSQSSPGTSSRLTTPPPLTPVSRPTPGKRMRHSHKERSCRREIAGDNTKTRKYA